MRGERGGGAALPAVGFLGRRRGLSSGDGNAIRELSRGLVHDRLFKEKGHVLTGALAQAFDNRAHFRPQTKLLPCAFHFRASHTAIMRQHETIRQLNILFDFVCTVWYHE